MKQPPLDLATGDRARAVIAQARRNGRDAVEALHAAGLILGPAQLAQVRGEALHALLQDVESWRPAEYIRRVNKKAAPTAQDMYNAILGYIAEYVEKEGLK